MLGYGRMRLRGLVLGRIDELPPASKWTSSIGAHWDGKPSKYDMFSKTMVEPLPPCAIAAASASLHEVEDLFELSCPLHICRLNSLAVALAEHDRFGEKCPKCLHCESIRLGGKPQGRASYAQFSFPCRKWRLVVLLFQGTRLPTLLRPARSLKPIEITTADVYNGASGVEPEFHLFSSCFLRSYHETI
jgi:hypothetical protein